MAWYLIKHRDSFTFTLLNLVRHVFCKKVPDSYVKVPIFIRTCVKT